MREGRELPFVVINGAISLDGKLALENESLIQFSSARDRRFVFELRATADGVLCGAETVETFSIDLAPGSPAWIKKRVRLGLRPELLRVIVSEDGKIDPEARIFKKPVSPIIVLTTSGVAKRCSQTLEGLATVKGFGKGAVDFRKAFRWLRAQWGIKRLVCEGGGDTNAALLRGGVVNELRVTVCPLALCGRRAMTLCDGIGFASLRQATRLRLKAVKRIKGELFLTYEVMAKEKQKRR